MKGIELFEKEADVIGEAFPGLSLGKLDGLPIVAGELDLIDEQGRFLTSYKIKIQPVENYPDRFPYVFETDGRIPHNVDWHMFESDGHCCIKNLPEELLKCKKGIDLPSFIHEEVIPYFFNQLYRERNGFFLNERAHGSSGQNEFFYELFNTCSLHKLYNLMLFVHKNDEPGRTENCFCGSNERYRKCHRTAFRIFSKFTKDEQLFFMRLLFDV